MLAPARGERRWRGVGGGKGSDREQPGDAGDVIERQLDLPMSASRQTDRDIVEEVGGDNFAVGTCRHRRFNPILRTSHGRGERAFVRRGGRTRGHCASRTNLAACPCESTVPREGGWQKYGRPVPAFRPARLPYIRQN